MNPTNAPFSARNRRETSWIEDDFPQTARNGLLHLLSEACDKGYLPDWIVVAKELGRILRVSPQDYSRTSIESLRRARTHAEEFLVSISWERVYDFCERLYGHLAQDQPTGYNDETVPKAQIQAFLVEGIQRLFDEESLGYEFTDGLVQRRGKRHTMAQVSGAEKALADQRLNSARKHFSKALKLFRDRKEPDLENVVKEAVCAIEAAAKELFPDSKANTLGDFIGWATSKEINLIPKTIGNTLAGLYGFRNSGAGVSHGAALGGIVTSNLAEYVLGTAASQIILLIGLAEEAEEPPF